MVRISGMFVNMNLPGIDQLPYIEIQSMPRTTYIKKTPDSVDFTDYIPDEQGIYFFVNYEGEIIYIGESENIRNRIKRRHEILADHRKDVISISWLVLPLGHEIERFLLEKAYIMAYKPKLNQEVRQMERE